MGRVLQSQERSQEASARHLHERSSKGDPICTYFETSARGRYALRSWMKDGIVWQVHNLLSNPPGIEFNLIFLRNSLLTYYEDEFRIPAIARIVNSLASGGFLIIGSHERMPFEVVDS